MEFTNAIYQFGADKEAFANLLIMLSPIAPHLCEELWQTLGNKESIFKANWPAYDPKMLIEARLTYVIQVNGKLRAKIEVEADTAEDKLKELALNHERVKPWLKGQIKNIIIVPQKLINIVA